MSYVDRENRYHYSESDKKIGQRLDLNDLLKRAKIQRSNDKKTNLLIFSGAVTVAFVVILLLNI